MYTVPARICSQSQMVVCYVEKPIQSTFQGLDMQTCTLEAKLLVYAATDLFFVQFLFLCSISQPKELNIGCLSGMLGFSTHQANPYIFSQ